MKRLRHSKRQYNAFQPLLRAIAVISSVAVLATGVTFAALQSQQAVLAGNSIKTASADLRISSTGSSSTYSDTRPGYAFGNVVPGVTPAPTEGNTFFLKNYGTLNMALKVAISSTPTNVDNADLSKTYFILSRVDGTAAQKLSLATLMAAHTSGGVAVADTLAGGVAAQYKIQVAMDADAFTGQKADIGGIDLVFSGTAVTQ